MLDPMMKPIFEGNTVSAESVMFIGGEGAKALLFPIEKVISVTSYDGKTVYEEGVDYVVENGALKLTDKSKIPCMASSMFYNYSGSAILVEKDGKTVPLYWGEGPLMTDNQVLVTYTHSSDWKGFAETSSSDVFADFIKKLESGKDMTVFFYGDSITYGACSSFNEDHAPYQDAYPVMFTKALADLYGYTVEFVDAGLVASSGMPTAKVPMNDHVAGKNGTITYVNTSIGGWTSTDAYNNSVAFVDEMISEYGCDLFIVAFGMNDGGIATEKTAENIRKIVDTALYASDDPAVLIVSTMMPNPRAVNGWLGLQPLQEDALIALAEEYREDGVACAVARMTSVSKAVLERKAFHDYSGNNINHPNDFFHRIYAQTVFEVVVGYENIK